MKTNFKKVLSLAVALMMVLTTLVIMPLTASAEAVAVDGLTGTGTEADPYKIGTKDEFAALLLAAGDTIVTGSEPYVVFTADIDVEGDENYSFNATDAYGGGAGAINWTIDGQGHTLQNMASPLFGSTGSGAFVTIKNLNIEGDIVSTIRYSGAFIGGAYGEILVDNCSFDGSLITTKSGGNQLLGGIIGAVISTNGNGKGVVKNCVNKGTITQNTAAGNGAAGGIVGSYDISGAGNVTVALTIENCVNEGTLLSETGSIRAAGGIFGVALPSPTQANVDWDLEIINCVNKGTATITELGETDVGAAGAIVGYMTRQPQYPNVHEESSATVAIVGCSSTVDGLAMANNSATLPLELHNYSAACDETCDDEGCEATRGATAEHAFDNCEDTACNACGATREALEHKYDNAQDADCNVCGKTRTVESAPAATETTTAAAVEEETNGCFGALNSTYAVLALVAVLGFAFVAKKKEEN